MEIFPDMKGMCDEIRKMSMIPGIWMEFETDIIGSYYADDIYKDKN